MIPPATIILLALGAAAQKCIRCPASTLSSESFGGPDVIERGYASADGLTASCQYRGVHQYSGCVYQLDTGNWLYRNAFDGAFVNEGTLIERQSSDNDLIGREKCPKQATVLAAGVGASTNLPGSVVVCGGQKSGERERCTDLKNLFQGTCGDLNKIATIGGFPCPGLNDAKGITLAVSAAVDKRLSEAEAGLEGKPLPDATHEDLVTFKGLFNTLVAVLAKRGGYDLLEKAVVNGGKLVSKATPYGAYCTIWDTAQLLSFACDKGLELYFDCDKKAERRAFHEIETTYALPRSWPQSPRRPLLARSDNPCADFVDTINTDMCAVTYPECTKTAADYKAQGMSDDEAAAAAKVCASNQQYAEVYEVLCAARAAVASVQAHCAPGGVLAEGGSIPPVEPTDPAKPADPANPDPANPDPTNPDPTPSSGSNTGGNTSNSPGGSGVNSPGGSGPGTGNTNTGGTSNTGTGSNSSASGSKSSAVGVRFSAALLVAMLAVGLC